MSFLTAPSSFLQSNARVSPTCAIVSESSDEAKNGEGGASSEWRKAVVATAPDLMYVSIIVI